ncbi:MAG: AAC(3) family N-acetyltransferase [Brumimicrobium sp.]|nr:AAC(3) family N-acetyltransferase [Brumimicrobium sp.]
MRNFIRSITPSFLLNLYRKYKKEQVRRALKKQALENKGWTEEQLLAQLRTAGIQENDTLLVHSALSKMGYVDGGAQTVVEALLKSVGKSGHLLMPNSPNASFQLDYIKHLEVFNVSEDASRLGAITEYFRKLPDAQRSCHPTEPVSCVGPRADYFVSGHFGELTPYTDKSPFYRVAEQGGKILMIGVTLDNAGTNLHTLEDAVDDFKFPVYFPEIFEVRIKSPDGSIDTMKTKVHDPVWSKKRRCDELIPLFEQAGCLKHVVIGNADSLLIDAREMLEVMIRSYREKGITMYTPQGS